MGLDRSLVATGFGLFMIFLDSMIVNVALPSIQTSFDVGEEWLQGWLRPTASA
jgi:MFS family permease